MLYRHLLLKDKINGIVWKVRIVSGELILDSTTYINAMSDFIFQDKTNPLIYWKLIIENGELLIEETTIQQDDIVGLRDGDNFWKLVVEDGQLFYISSTEGELYEGIGGGGRGLAELRRLKKVYVEFEVAVLGVKLLKNIFIIQVKGRKITSFVLTKEILSSLLLPSLKEEFEIKGLVKVKCANQVLIKGFKQNLIDYLYQLSGQISITYCLANLKGIKFNHNVLIDKKIISEKLNKQINDYLVRGNVDYSPLVYALLEV